MKRIDDMILFEERSEIEELLNAVEKYVKQNPKEKNNKILERFYDLLDIMDLVW